jgi:hypothetical protein
MILKQVIIYTLCLLDIQAGTADCLMGAIRTDCCSPTNGVAGNICCKLLQDGSNNQGSLKCSTNGCYPTNEDVHRCVCNVTSLSPITVTCDSSLPSSSGSEELCCTSDGILSKGNTHPLTLQCTMKCSILPSSTPPSSTTTESPMLSSEATKTTPAQTAMIKQNRTTTIQTTMLTKPSTKPSPDHSLPIVTGVAGGTLLALLLTSIIVLYVVMNWKKKRGHSLREGGNYGTENAINNLYSGCPAVEAQYECPVRSLATETAPHELEECTHNWSAPSAQPLHITTTTMEDDYSLPQDHINHRIIPPCQSAGRALHQKQEDTHRTCFPVLGSVRMAKTMEDDYSLLQDHINDKLPRNEGARRASPQEYHRNRTDNKPAAHSVAESSQADGGEHVYSTLEPPCGLLEKSCEETKTLSQNGTRLTQF